MIIKNLREWQEIIINIINIVIMSIFQDKKVDFYWKNRCIYERMKSFYRRYFWISTRETKISSVDRVVWFINSHNSSYSQKRYFFRWMKSFYRNFIWISIRDSSFFGNNVEKIKKLKIIWKIDIIIYLSEIGLIILFIFLFNKMVTLFIILLYNKWKMNKTGKIDIIIVILKLKK